MRALLVSEITWVRVESFAVPWAHLHDARHQSVPGKLYRRCCCKRAPTFLQALSNLRNAVLHHTKWCVVFCSFLLWNATRARLIFVLYSKTANECLPSQIIKKYVQSRLLSTHCVAGEVWPNSQGWIATLKWLLLRRRALKSEVCLL